MRDDVKFTHLKSGGKMTRAITLLLKNPKEDKTKHGVRIDIFETEGPLKWLCAVTAAMKYKCMITTSETEPFATTREGKGYTG